VPITAVTATATAQVQQDIKAILGISNSAVVHQVGGSKAIMKRNCMAQQGKPR
jgi:superfamily II DNA helicase RecQ